MAEAILIGLGRHILSQLSSQAIQEIGRWWNVNHELDKLEKTVSTIQAVLLDAEEEREPSHQFKHWLGKLRQVLYDAEEVVDDFATEVLRRKVLTKCLLPKEVKLFFSCSANQILYARKMAHRIKGIREALDDITNDRQKFHFSVRRTSTLFITSEGRDKVVLFRRVEKAVSKGGEKPIGREVEKTKIVGRLLGKANDAISRQGVLVISIVGSGGLGKTTLAQLVYDDSEVKSYFELRMWVSVGDVDFSIGEIAEKATKPAIEIKGGEKREAVGTEGDKIGEFKKLISRKRFLLVLDDVWSNDQNKWVDLEDLWRDCESESRIMVTTRFVDVAKMMRSEFHRLGYLSPSDSWSLFVKIVFGGGEPENKDVLDNGKKIVAKCGGVPLAIKTIGNMLYSLNPETEWLPYVTNELSKYPQANNNIFPTLQLSYDNLPSPLKYCFAYCSLFPKGYIIDVKTLIQLWIAQGYIRSSEMGECLEDVGHRYCKYLVSRSFFQDEEVDEISGNLESCKMHDIMHELASFIAGSETTVWSDTSAKDIIHKHTRHLSFGLNAENECYLRYPFPSPLLKSMLGARKLRTSFFSLNDDFSHYYHYYAIHVDDCKKIFKKLRSLLVLDLSCQNIESRINSCLKNHNIHPSIQMLLWDYCLTFLGFKTYTIPESIGRLKHLRYLDLSGQRLSILPKSLTKLYNLQVLKVRRCRLLKQLPRDIKKLVSLRHLDCSGCEKLAYMPRGLGELPSLQTLTRFIVAPAGGSNRSKHMARLEELKLLNLRDELTIDNLDGEEADESEFQGAALKQKDRLLSLSLEWNLDSSQNHEKVLQHLEPHPSLKKLVIRNYRGVNFPNWFPNLRSLVNLKFSCCKSCQYLPPLGGLRYLKSLSIWQCDDLKCVDNSEGGIMRRTSATTFFPCLMSLKISCCNKLEGWWNAKKDNFDYGLSEFPCLSSLEVENCPNLTSMPLFPTLNDELVVTSSSIEPFQQTLKAAARVSSPSFSSSLVHPLSNLKKLCIEWMEDLTCLPEEGMQHLTSLQSLRIKGCPQLKKRCGTKNGADWHKIFHIPNIEVERKKIQINGRYQFA